MSGWKVHPPLSQPTSDARKRGEKVFRQFGKEKTTVPKDEK